MIKVHKHHFYFGIVLFVLGGIISYQVSSAGYYPLALVNNQFIWARDFRAVADPAFNFYINTLNASKKEGMSEEDARNLIIEVKRATLEKLIEEKLFENEVNKRFGSGLGGLIDKKIESVENANLGVAVQSVYGLSLDDFKKTVLAPQAARELLMESFRQNNEDFSPWLKNQKKAAKVYVLSSEFVWDGETLNIR